MTREQWLQRAHWLALFTIFYNIAEGVGSVWFGVVDETLSLFGFGMDSFIEVISAVGVWHMLRRIAHNGGEQRDAFEQRALRITGTAFNLLTAGLLLTAVINISSNHKPETTLWGIIISLISISFMWFLINLKTKAGTALASPAILADAACSRACLYLSLVLMVSSVGYELTGLGLLDAVGAGGVAWLAYKEGREAFDKAKGLDCSCSCACGGGA